MSGSRTIKLAKQIQRDLPPIIDKLKAEYRPNSLITITDVVVTGDLGLAKVYVSILPKQEEAGTFGWLSDHEANKEIRHLLAQKIKNQVRKIPELTFYLDETFERAHKIEALLSRVRKDDE